MATQQAVRRWIMTGAVAAVTITGTIYGAGLKGDQEVKQKKKQILEATPEEMIAQLESARADLVLKKKEMERKIANFAERSRSKEQGQAEPK
ncbi:Nn.00g094640.m01.CDS01 [Neocucurbitaria sp. VM-36]